MHSVPPSDRFPEDAGLAVGVVRRAAGVAMAVLALWSLPLGTAAQEKSPAVPPDRGASSAANGTWRTPPIIEREPPWVYMWDEQSQRLVPVIEGAQFDSLKPRLEAPVAAHQFRDVSLAGRVVGNRAQLEVAIELQTRGDRDGALSIPLGVDGVLRDSLRYQGPGDASLTYSPDAGLVCLLRFPPPEVPNRDTPPRPAAASAGEGAGGLEEAPPAAAAWRTHRLRFTIWTAVSEAGVWRAIRLKMPAASWQVELTVNEASIRPEAQQGVIVQSESSGAGTKITAIGATPELSLRWRPENAPGPRPFLQSHAQVQWTVEHPELIRAEVRLQVDSLGGPLQSIQLRLPAGVRFLANAEPGVDVAAASTRDGRQLLQISPVSGSEQSVKAALTAVLRRDARDSGDPFDAADFEVVGAALQSGEIQVVADDIWDVRIADELNMLRRAPPGGLEESDDGLSFAYSSLPCRLALEVQLQRTALEVTPEYHLHVGESELRLEMRFTCRFAEQRNTELGVELAGWTLREAGPAAALNTDPAMLLAARSPLIVPLKKSDGPLSLVFEAFQRFRPGQPIEVALPTIRRPLLDDATPVRTQLARLYVSKDESIELQTPPELLRGLTEETSAGPEFAGLLAFQENGGAESSALTLQAEVRERQVVVRDPKTELQIQEDLIDARHLWRYEVAFGSLSELEFTLPESLAAQLQAEGESLRIELRTGDQTLELSPQWRDNAVESRLYVELDSPLTAAELTIAYQTPRRTGNAAPPEPDEGESLVLPLIRPSGEAELVGDRIVELRAAGNLRAELRGDAWTRLDAEPDALTVVGRADEDALPVRLVALQSKRSETLTLESSWLQTWMNQEQRQDRAAFRLLGAPENVQVLLPQDGSGEITDLAVAIDGDAADDFQLIRQANGQLMLYVPWKAADDLPHTLEIRCRFGSRPPVGRMAIQPPQVLGLDARRYYWQVVLPPREHLLAEGVGVSAEMALQWSHYWPSWSPRLATHELERWVGAVQSEPIPSSANQYLFTGFGPFPVLRPLTVKRSWLVGGGAATLLAFGLAFLQFSFLRRAPMLLVLAAALGALTLLYPESAVLAAQGVALGLMLLVLSMVLRRALSRRPLTVEYHAVAPVSWSDAPAPPGSQSRRELSTTTK